MGNIFKHQRFAMAPLALALALVSLTPEAQAHGGAAEMVPLQSTLENFGATVKYDDYANVFVISKDGAYVKVKPNSKVAMLNGKRLELSVPVVFKKNTAYMSHDFINEVFQSGLDKTFVVETRPHPLNALSADEIKTAVAAVQASAHAKSNLRYTAISLREPKKSEVWDFVFTGKPVSQPRQADVVVAAVGRRNTLTAGMVKPGAVIIDVGMNRNDEGKLCGDVDFAGVSQVAGFITPVPGGVGPMTRAMLLVNTIEAAERKHP